MKFVVGIDEAGRGPLAGPVAVGIVVAPANFDIRRAFPGVNDSKKLSEKKREEIFALLQEKSKKMVSLRFLVVMASAKVIDEKGISYAVRQSIYKGIRKLAPRDALGQAPGLHNVHVLLDGLLKAPPEYSQTTIIRGDATEPIISLASVAAKVTRDRLMKRLSKKYPGYGFEQHKGYGTKAHKSAIKRLGMSDIHRKSFKGCEK